MGEEGEAGVFGDRFVGGGASWMWVSFVGLDLGMRVLGFRRITIAMSLAWV